MADILPEIPTTPGLDPSAEAPAATPAAMPAAAGGKVANPFDQFDKSPTGPANPFDAFDKPDPGGLSDLMHGIKAGGFDAPKMTAESGEYIGRALHSAGNATGMPSLAAIGDAIQAKTQGWSQEMAAGQAADSGQQQSAYGQDGGFIRRNMYGLGRGLGQIGAAGVTGAVVGGTLGGVAGSVIGPEGTVAGAAGGAVTGALRSIALALPAVFGLSTAEQTDESVTAAAKAAGASDEDAANKGLAYGAGAGAVAGAGAFLLNKIGLGNVAKPFVDSIGGAAEGSLVSAVLNTTLKGAATSVAKAGVEGAAVNVAQQDAIEAINAAGGAGDGPTVSGSIDAAVQGGLIASVMHTGSEAVHSAKVSATVKLLADPAADPQQREKAAIGAATIIGTKDPALASDFALYADNQLAKGLPIEVGPDALYQGFAQSIRQQRADDAAQQADAATRTTKGAYPGFVPTGDEAAAVAPGFVTDPNAPDNSKQPPSWLQAAGTPTQNAEQAAAPDISRASGNPSWLNAAANPTLPVAPEPPPIPKSAPPELAELTPIFHAGSVDDAINATVQTVNESIGRSVLDANQHGVAAGVITPAGSEVTPSAPDLAIDRQFYADQAAQAQADMRNQAIDANKPPVPPVPEDAFAQRQAQIEAEAAAQRDAAFQQANRDQLGQQADQATAVSAANETPATPAAQTPPSPMGQAMQMTMDRAASRMQNKPTRVTTAELGMLAQHHPDPAVRDQAAQMVDARANKATVFSPDQPSQPFSLDSVRDNGHFSFSPERGQEAAGAAAEPAQPVRTLEQTEPAVAPVKVALDQQAKAMGRDVSGASIETVDLTSLPDARTAANNGVEGATTLSKSDVELAQKQVAVLGKKLVVFRQSGGETGQMDGMVSPDGKTIYLNADAAGAHHLVIVGHELAHTMRIDAPALFDGLRKSVLKQAGKGALSDFYRYYMNERGMSEADVAKAMKDPATRDNMTEEFVADLVGNRFGEYRTWQQMFANAGKENRGLVYRIADYITKFIDKLLGNESFKKFATDDMVGNLQAVRQSVRKALSAYAVGEGSKAMEHEAGQLRAHQENLRAGIEPRKLVAPVENGRADVGKAPSKAAPAPVAERDAPAVQSSEGREPMRGPKSAVDEQPVKDEAGRQQRSQDSAKAELDDAQATALETAGKETNERNAKQQDAEMRTLDVIRKDTAAEREPVAQAQPAQAQPAEAKPVKSKAITQDMLARSEADIEKARAAAQPTLDAIQKHFEDDKTEAGLNDIVGRDVAAENRPGENVWNTAERLAQSKVDEAQAAHDRLEEQYNEQQKAKPVLDQEMSDGSTRRESINRDVAAGRTELTRVKGKEATWWELHHPDGGEGSLLLHPDEAAHAKKAIKASRDATNKQLADQAAQDIANRKADRSAKASANIRKQYHVDPTKDSMMTAVAKLGGVKKAEAHSLYGDQGQYYHGIKQALTPNGRSVDAMRSALAELGYVKTDEHGKADIQDFDEKFTDGLNGNEHFTPDGEQTRAEARAEAEPELNAQDVQNEDYNEAPEHVQAPVDEEIHDGPLTAAEEAAFAEHDHATHGDVPFDEEPSSTSDTEDPFETDAKGRGVVPEDRAPDAARAEASDRPVTETEQASTPEAGERSGEGSGQDFGLTGETPEQGEARLQDEDAARKARTRAALDEERRMQADEDAKTFRLTGSDREADADPDQNGFKFSRERSPFITRASDDGLERLHDRTVSELKSDPKNEQLQAKLQDIADERLNRASEAGGHDFKFSRQRASNYLGDMTPAETAAAKNIGAIAERKTVKQQMQEMKTDLKKKLTQGIADQFYPIKELSPEAYQATRMSKGYTGTVEATLLYGKPFLRDGVPDVDVNDKGYAHVLASLDGEHSRFFLWMAARRAQELKKLGKENLFTDNDISALLGLDRNDAAAGRPDRAAKFAAAEKEHMAFNEAVLDIARQKGLIGDELFDTLKNNIHVAFYRVMDEDAGGMRGPGKGDALINQAAFKKLKGGTNKLNEDLLANTLANWSHLLGASMRNGAAQLTMDAAVKAKIAVPVSYKKASKGAVRVMVKGKAKFYEVNDPHLLTAISAMTAPIDGKFVKTLSTFKRLLTTGTTLAPSFRFNNLIRDTLSTLATTDISLNPVKNLMQGIKSQAHGSQTHASMLASGGIINFGTMLEGNEAKRTHQLIQMGVDKATILNNKGAVDAFWSKFKQGAEFYHELGNKVENANRGALYEQLRAKGVSHADAAFQARDIMDFSLQGSNNVVRFLTTAVPFLNARIQGAYKIGRAVGEQPMRAGMVMGAVAMASLALMLRHQDDPDWKARPDWDRDNYWWWKVGNDPWVDKDGMTHHGIAYRMPKPFEVGAVGTLVERTWERMFDPEMTNSRYVGELRDVLMSQFNLNPVPQMVKPLLNVYANRDDFTGNQIESTSQQSLQPEDRYTPYTSMTARFLGQLGMPDPSQLMLGRYSKLSPVQMDSLIRGYFGWSGVAATTMVDAAVRPFSSNGDKPAMTLRQKTLGFMDDLPAAQSRYADTLYEQQTAIDQAYASWRAALKSGQFEKAQDIMNGSHVFGPSNRTLIQEHGLASKISQAESRYALQAKRIADSPTLSAETKRTMLNRIDQQRNNLAQSGSSSELAMNVRASQQ